jgi:hypothetical protein
VTPPVSPSPAPSPSRKSGIVPGTATFEGHVYDDASKGVLGQSEVMIPELNVETFSNTQGKFTIKRIPLRDRPYEVMIIHPGFEHHYDKRTFDREQKYKVEYFLKMKGF